MSPPPYGRTVTQPLPTSPYHRGVMDPYLRGGDLGGLGSGVEGAGVGCMLPDSAHQNNTFEVLIKRNSLGLGFSICGGLEAPAPWTNLIRIKKVFPLQPAWQTGQLKIGDVLLNVSGVPLSGLSLRQALDILRTSPEITKLLVCRIPDPVSDHESSSSHSLKQHRSSVVRSYSYGPFNINTWQHCRSDLQHLKQFENLSLSTNTECRVGLNSAGESMEIDISPSTPEKEWSPPSSSSEHQPPSDNTLHLLKPLELLEDTLMSQQPSTKIIGAFSVTLTKVKGSLGFSIFSCDDNIFNHSIKAVLRDPALSDGRIQVADKLVTANGKDLSSLSHEELIAFLRQCDDTVSLGLFRDESRSGTPLDCDSPPLPKSRDSSLNRKHLRYEAKELVRSLQSSRTSLEKAGLGSHAGSYSATAGTLGRRRVRQFSPANQTRLAPTTALGGGAPTIESPGTPHNSSAPPSLGLGGYGSTPVARHHNFSSVENNNCDDRLCIQELDSGDGLQSNTNDYLVSTPGTGGAPTPEVCSPADQPPSRGGGWGAAPDPPPRLMLHQATPPNFRDEVNRNSSVPRESRGGGFAPHNLMCAPGSTEMFLSCEQSRSLPRGMPLFPTTNHEPEGRASSSRQQTLTRPSELNLNNANKRQAYYFSN